MPSATPTTPRFYFARHGLVWSVGNSTVRTLTVAEAALGQLGRMACEAKSDVLSTNYLAQHRDLVAAIREARSQVANDGAPDLSTEVAA